MRGILILSTIAACYLFGCSTENDLGPYYETTFVDGVAAVVPADSVHIILTQVPVSVQVKDVVPFQVITDSSLGDSVKMILDVLFGSYSQTPTPSKSIIVRKDSILLWYAHFGPPPGGVGKFSIPSETQTSPRPTYYSIQNVLIRTHPSMTVSFESELYR